MSELHCAAVSITILSFKCALMQILGLDKTALECKLSQKMFVWHNSYDIKTKLLPHADNDKLERQNVT